MDGCHRGGRSGLIGQSAGGVVRDMATYQDIVDYYQIDKFNGDTSTRSLAAVVLYRLIKGLLRHMAWPEGAGVEFGRFESGTDSCQTTVKFTVSERAFPMTFAIGYIRPTDAVSTKVEPDLISWQLTIDKSPALQYTPSRLETVPALYEHVSGVVLRKALSALPSL